MSRIFTFQKIFIAAYFSFPIHVFRRVLSSSSTNVTGIPSGFVVSFRTCSPSRYIQKWLMIEQWISTLHTWYNFRSLCVFSFVSYSQHKKILHWHILIANGSRFTARTKCFVSWMFTTFFFNVVIPTVSCIYTRLIGKCRRNFVFVKTFLFTDQYSLGSNFFSYLYVEGRKNVFVLWLYTLQSDRQFNYCMGHYLVASRLYAPTLYILWNRKNCRILNYSMFLSKLVLAIFGIYMLWYK